jgi:ribosomal protein S18 acetylase RimI-like enzyme
MKPIVRRASVDDASSLAELARLTFPLACPPGHTAENIADHLAQVLSVKRFEEYATSSDFALFIAENNGFLLGFCLVDYRASDDPDVRKALPACEASAELSKLYVHPDSHGAGTAQSLLNAALQEMTDREIHSAWLTVSQLNDRANAFYEKSGFAVIAQKKYQVGTVIDDDYLRMRELVTSQGLSTEGFLAGNHG